MDSTDQVSEMGIRELSQQPQGSDAGFLHLIAVSDEQDIPFAERETLASGVDDTFSRVMRPQKIEHLRIKPLGRFLSIEKLKMSFDRRHSGKVTYNSHCGGSRGNETLIFRRR